MKKLTRNEWENLQEQEKLKEERIEAKCENIANTTPISKRFQTVRNIFK